jgi:hypothetical protein
MGCTDDEPDIGFLSWQSRIDSMNRPNFVSAKLSVGLILSAVPCLYIVNYAFYFDNRCVVWW